MIGVVASFLLVCSDILSNRGETHQVPASWQPLLGEYDALVVIPDMHMFYYGSSQDCFQYGARPMRDFLKHLVDVRDDYASRGKRLAVVQLGDLYELRYPHPKTGLPLTKEVIVKSHRLYTEIIDLMHRLDTTFVIGNHDAEQPMRRRWMRRSSFSTALWGKTAPFRGCSIC